MEPDELTGFSSAEALQLMVGDLVRLLISRNHMTSVMDERIMQVKDSFAADFVELDRKIDQAIAEIAVIASNEFDTLFADSKSYRTLLGTLMARRVAPKTKVDEAALLEVARKHGLVRQLFDGHMTYALKPGALDELFANPDEVQDEIAECISVTPEYDSVTVKPDLNAAGVDPSQLSTHPIPIVQIVAERS